MTPRQRGKARPVFVSDGYLRWLGPVPEASSQALRHTRTLLNLGTRTIHVVYAATEYQARQVYSRPPLQRRGGA